MMVAVVEISLLTESDRASWEMLARGKDTYFGAGMAEPVAAVGEHAEGDEFRIGVNAAQVRYVQGGQGDRMSVDRIGLAAVAGGEDPHLSREFRRDIEDDFPVMDQAVGQVAADAAAALRSPKPGRRIVVLW
ncbi:hypothetical protein [Nocardia brasiliensis]|uniref:hypothetical protein n=1 Tax=Nocardia brasiliensis TaxID=37326 RepID=UPI0024580784|nr:hypothetical protein [Nocardia brasiliensis]